MSSYANQLTRVEITGSRYENGQLLVSGRGLAGEAFKDLVWYDPHGFHSRPHAGSIGVIQAPGGRRDQAIVMAASDPKKLPELKEGESAMYDSAGNVVTLGANGWQFNTDVTITGNLTVSGDTEIDGKLHATGDIKSDSPDAEDE